MTPRSVARTPRTDASRTLRIPQKVSEREKVWPGKLEAFRADHGVAEVEQRGQGQCGNHQAAARNGGHGGHGGHGGSVSSIARPRIYARGADLIVMAPVSNGAELIADGSIHVYAPLRGRALAGASGNMAARIFTLSMEAELVSIAGMYRTFESDLSADVMRRPAQVRLISDRIDIQGMR